MNERTALEFDAVVERKASTLPRYVEVPSASLATWGLRETTAVEVIIDDVDIGRRNVKPWGKERDCWFIDLPELACRKASIDTGDHVVVALRRATTGLPEELSSLLRSNPSARERWNGFTESRQRMLADQVRSAKKKATRARRAENAFCRPD